MIRRRESVGIEWRSEGIRAVKVERGFGALRLKGAVTLPRDGESALGGALLAALGPARDSVVIGLPGRQGFLRQLQLPAKDPSLLRRVLEFDLERHLPIPAEKLCFDFAPGGRTGSLWTLLLGAVPKQFVEAAVEPFALDGIRPTGATLVPAAAAAAAALTGAPRGRGLMLEADERVLGGQLVDAGRVVWQDERALGSSLEEDLLEAARALVRAAPRTVPITWTLWMGKGPREPIERWAREESLACLTVGSRVRGAAALDPTYTAALALALQGVGLGPWRLNLLNPAALPSRRTTWLRGAAVAALALALLGAGWWFNSYRLERRALAKNLAKIEWLAPQAQALEAEARRGTEVRRLVEGLETARRGPSKITLLRELTVLIPRHTWLTRVSYKRGEVELSGYSSSPQEVIPRLEASPLFQQASFTGSIEREGGQERFTIRVRLR